MCKCFKCFNRLNHIEISLIKKLNLLKNKYLNNFRRPEAQGGTGGLPENVPNRLKVSVKLF